MLRKAFIEFSVLSLFLSLLLTIGINFDLVKAVNHSYSGTYVGGIIWENTTWTLENSPYIIMKTVQIPENVTLIIEPGVTVIASPSLPEREFLFVFAGKIYAHGASDSKITFDGGGKNGFFGHVSYDRPTALLSLKHCIIKNGSFLIWPESGGYGCYLELKYSEIVGITRGSDIPIWHSNQDIFIEQNIFVDSAGFRFASSVSSVYIKNNLFIGCRPGVYGALIVNWYCGSGGATIVKYNSFIGAKNVLSLPEGYFNAAIIATENYWGTTDTGVIDSMIYDKKDNIKCSSFIEYLPILTEPHPNTPTLPLIVKFTYLPTTVYEFGKVTFDASASFGLYSSIVNYTWDFGDGNITTTSSPKVEYCYATPGNYDVTLIVTDEFGFRNSTTMSITVLEDNVSPVTMDYYGGGWCNKDFTVTLTATDHESGIADTYYRINNGPIKAVSIHGHPRITTEGANNTLEYWGVDNAGNEEAHKILTGIKLDKTAPSSSISFDGVLGENGWFVSDVTVRLTASDGLSGVDSIIYSFNNVEWK
ncbi:MAG: PKD domain-containing protein, partial [Nitrososphaerota archaeon]|nr:PKD domain-containing protein [Nitrososphaerota archaeon]